MSQNVQRVISGILIACVFLLVQAATVGYVDWKLIVQVIFGIFLSVVLLLVVVLFFGDFLDLLFAPWRKGRPHGQKSVLPTYSIRSMSGSMSFDSMTGMLNKEAKQSITWGVFYDGLVKAMDTVHMGSPVPFVAKFLRYGIVIFGTKVWKIPVPLIVITAHFDAEEAESRLLHATVHVLWFRFKTAHALSRELTSELNQLFSAPLAEHVLHRVTWFI